jgi:hypothetical protein
MESMMTGLGKSSFLRTGWAAALSRSWGEGPSVGGAEVLDTQPERARAAEVAVKFRLVMLVDMAVL